ncbi:MAG TPA: efflux RND transporter periplasmic adaptor subunit [Bradyrhizobium sp.]|nr:efflux RND transporter periplasmic adaptor subunit [Bradyrhizobium sp.]
MNLSDYLKPALAVAFFAVLATVWYWFEHRSRPEEKETPGTAVVSVTKSTRACFSDQVRVTGFVVPRREAVVGVDQEGSKVIDLLVHEGEMVTDNQELARLTPPPAQPGGGGARSNTAVSLRAPAAGLLTQVNTIVGAPASPQAGPIFRIAVNNEIDLDAEVPAVHMMKLNPGANVRISRDNGQDVVGRVRLISPQIDRNTQLGHVRITLTSNPSLRIGMFAQASIDAKRSCNVAIPRTAVDHLTVQVVKGDTVEMRRVKVGLVSDKLTEILEGLDIDETVVADAGSSLHDGDHIKTKFPEDSDRTQVR